jgi:hypothetical protein
VIALALVAGASFGILPARARRPNAADALRGAGNFSDLRPHLEALRSHRLRYGLSALAITVASPRWSC